MSMFDCCPALVSRNCVFHSFFYLMNNKYFAVFLPSLGIEEKLFHLGELIIKIYSLFCVDVGDDQTLTDLSREAPHAWT